MPAGGVVGQGNLQRSGGGDVADDEISVAAAGQGLVVSTGILGDLVLPAGAFDPGRADEIRDLAAQAAVYATQARGPGTLRAYRSAWRQYDAWCVRLGLPGAERRSPPGRHVPDRRGRAPRRRDAPGPPRRDRHRPPPGRPVA
jgi:hypothetical protein